VQLPAESAPGRRASYCLGASVDVEIARIDASANELELRPV
jgi:hypothetical protein